MIETIKPAPDYLLVKAKGVTESKTGSGILLSMNKTYDDRAEVINVGDNVTDYAQKDTIILSKGGSVEVEINGQIYNLIHNDNVLGKVLCV